jgi:HEPN domain-containing protein
VRDVSSPSPEQVEYAGLLKRLAAGDLVVCRKLVHDTDVEDHAIGFHAQQSVEKALKVALVLAGVELPYSHDLELLVDLVKGSGTELPADLTSPEWLTPWAVDLRYGEPTALDRAAALAVAESAVSWAASRLAAASPSVPQVDSREEISGGSLPGDQP